MRPTYAPAVFPPTKTACERAHGNGNRAARRYHRGMTTPPPPAPSSQAALTRQAVLVVIWIGFLFFLGSLCLAAAYVADARQDGERIVTVRPLGGALALVPYVLPLALLGAGLALFRRFARPGAVSTWPAVTRAFVALLALYEVNSVVGFVLFIARPAPASTFFISAAASFVLLLVGLWQLVAVWPRE